MRVERGATGVTATALNVTGGQDGDRPGPGHRPTCVLRDLMIDGVSNNGVRTSSPNAQILGGRISDSTTGIDAEAATTINGTEIAEVERGDPGPVGRSGGRRRRDGVRGDLGHQHRRRAARSCSPTPGSTRWRRSRGQADYQGLNTLSLPPLNVLGVIGIPLVLLALLLDQVQRFRQRQRGGGDRRRLPPPRLQAGTH